jgi:hypothetical protein
LLDIIKNKYNMRITNQINIKTKTEQKIPPTEVVEAVKLIEKWVSEQTDRDDWVIGGVASSKGFKRLLKTYNKLKKYV